MTVQAQDSVQYYEGPISIGTELSITEFTFIDNSHVSLKIRGIDNIWEYGTDYTVEGADTLVRTVTLNREVENGQVLAVYLDVPITQNISPEEGGNFPASTNEFVLDKLTYICQMLYEKITRALQASIDIQFNGTLPNPEGKANKIIALNSTGTGLAYSTYDVSELEYIANRLYASIDNVDITANNIEAINKVSANKENIDINAANITDIQNAKENAQICINKALEAAASALSASIDSINSNIWAEGTDEQVEELGGQHSAKKWAEAASQGQIQSDWLQEDDVQKDYIRHKPTNLSDFIDDLGTDPIHTHSQPVNVLVTLGTIDLTDNSINLITPTGNVIFVLPTITDDTKFHQILVQVNLSTVYSIDVDTVYFFNNSTPDLSEIGVYNLIFEYDNINQYWVCGVISKGLDIYDFSQPVLTANGTLGGSDFAVAASATSSTYYAYHAMDSDTSTQWRPGVAAATFTLYNPKPLCLNNLDVGYSSSSYATTVDKIEISDDNTNWTEITFVQGGANPNFEYTLNNLSFAKYYRLTFGALATARITEIKAYGKVWNM